MISHLWKDWWIIKHVRLNQVSKWYFWKQPDFPNVLEDILQSQIVRGSWNPFFFSKLHINSPKLCLSYVTLNCCALPHSYSYLTRLIVLAVWIQTNVAHPGGQHKSWQQISRAFWWFLLPYLSPSVGNIPPERVEGYYNKLDVSSLHFSPPKILLHKWSTGKASSIILKEISIYMNMNSGFSVQMIYDIIRPYDCSLTQ